MPAGSFLSPKWDTPETLVFKGSNDVLDETPTTNLREQHLAGMDGKGSGADILKTLEAVARQRTAEANGADALYVAYVPQVGDKTAPDAHGMKAGLIISNG